MSHETPGDNKRCDHCDRPGKPYEYHGRTFSGLSANRGERLCPTCLDREVVRESNTPVGPMGVPARDYVTPIAFDRYR